MRQFYSNSDIYPVTLRETLEVIRNKTTMLSVLSKIITISILGIIGHYFSGSNSTLEKYCHRAHLNYPQLCGNGCYGLMRAR